MASSVQTHSQARSFPAIMAVAIGVLGVCLVAALVFMLDRKAKQNDMTEARSDISRLTKVAVRNVELNFQTIDMMLKRADERQHFNALFGGNLRGDVEQHFNVWLREAPHVAALLTTDANGVIQILAQKREYQSTLPLAEGMNFPDSEHFEHHKDDESIELLIGAAEFSGEKGHHYIYFSRRIENLDGSFGGLIVAIMDGHSITDYMRSVEAGRHTQFALLLDQAHLLVDNSGLEPSLSLVKTVYNEAARVADRADGAVIFPYNLEQKQMLFSFATLPNMPVMVALVMHENDIFRNARESRQDALIFSAIFLGFLATVLAFAFTIARQMQNVKLSEEKALLASHAKSDFLAKMSHELRTPLNAIIGFSEMMGANYFGKINEKQKERLNDIHLCGMHLLELINDILDFSKGEAGKIVLQESTFEISPFVETTLRMIAPRARQKHIDLIIKGQKTLPTLHADEKRLRQVMLNLLSNAVKFTPENGNITVTVMTDSDQRLVLSVQDTGIGMDAADIPKALEVFEQVHSDGAYEGTGLGLPLAKMFTELHGGTFNVQSQKGLGTTIFVILPKERLRRAA